MRAAIKRDEEEYSYRVYMSDAIKAAAGNTSHYVVPGTGVVEHGVVLTRRWADLDRPQEKEEKREDPRSASEIAHDMWKRIRGDQV